MFLNSRDVDPFGAFPETRELIMMAVMFGFRREQR